MAEPDEDFPSVNGELMEGVGNGHQTFSGAGFGTLMMQFSVDHPIPTPQVASTRAYLRNGLPSLYQDGDFGMRFVGSLEELLDPIVAILDSLHYNFDANHAPPDILSLLAAWLGVDLDETQKIADQREMVLRASELGRRRGTVKGLELALKLHFPEVPMRVEDNVQAAIARCIEQYKPVHSTYRLRVKAAKKKVES